MAVYKRYAKNEDKDTICYGIELEFAEPEYGIKRKKSKITRDRLYGIIEKKFKNKRGSIICNMSYDGGGIEVAFQPMTIKRMIEERGQINKIISLLRRYGYNSDNTHSGMHVHIPINKFSPGRGRSLLDFMGTNKDLVRIMSGRSFIHGFNSTVTVPSYTGNFTERDVHNRAYAINRKGYPTLEIRIFGSTMSFNTMMARVEFLDSVINRKRIKNNYYGRWQQANDSDVLNANSYIPEVLRHYLKHGENSYLIRYLIAKNVIDKHVISLVTSEYGSCNTNNFAIQLDKDKINFREEGRAFGGSINLYALNKHKLV